MLVFTKFTQRCSTSAVSNLNPGTPILYPVFNLTTSQRLPSYKNSMFSAPSNAQQSKSTLHPPSANTQALAGGGKMAEQGVTAL